MPHIGLQAGESVMTPDGPGVVSKILVRNYSMPLLSTVQIKLDSGSVKKYTLAQLSYLDEQIKLADLLPEEYKRNYKKEYENYHSSPRQKKRRAQRNKSRRKMERLGHVKKGDGKDCHHKNRDTSDTSSKNLVAIPKSKNRSKNQ